MNANLSSVLWSDTFVVLLAGAAIVWLLACLACRLTASAAWQRAIWQMAVLALAGLLACELCGIGPGLQEVFNMASGGREPPGAQAAARIVDSSVDVSAQNDRAPAEIGETLILSTEYSVSGEAFSESRIESGRMEPQTHQGAYAPRSPAAISEPKSTSAVLPLLWLAGALLILARLLVGQLLLVRFALRHERSIPSAGSTAIQLRLLRLARRVGLPRVPRMIRARTLRGPVAFGMWRPTIGLPSTFERDFSPGEQDAMLAHELAHLASRDPAWRLAADGVTALLWWHPLVWLIRARLQAACEVAADEACLVVEDGPQLLAGCLVALAKRVSPAMTPGWLAVEGSGFRSSLGRRVGRLLSLPATSRRPGAASFGGICLTGAAALVAVSLLSTAWARPQAALTGETSMKSIFASSWRQSLAGGLLLAVLGPSSPAAADDEPRREERPAAERREGERPEARREGDRERPAAREGERREGDRPAAERREGDRPAAERREGDRPPAARREGEGERPATPRREGERPVPQTRRDGERPEGARPPREGEGVANRMQEERRKIEEQVAHLKREAGEHARAGRKDAAEKLEQEVQPLIRRLEQLRNLAADRPAGDRRPDGAPEGRRPDGPQDGRRPEGAPEGRRPDGPPGERPGFPPGGPPRDELLSVLRELRAEVQNLRNEVNDLKARLATKKDIEREPSPRGEGERDRR